MAKQVEPACHPRCEGGVFWWREHEGPEVGAAGRGNGGDDFGHAESDGEGEEGDYEPADGHCCAMNELGRDLYGCEGDLRATGVQSIAEERGDTCDNGLVLLASVLGILAGGSRHTIIENEMPKLCIRPQSLFSSCL